MTDAEKIAAARKELQRLTESQKAALLNMADLLERTLPGHTGEMAGRVIRLLVNTEAT